eukprot:3195339-Amphidinium_carterae.1
MPSWHERNQLQCCNLVLSVGESVRSELPGSSRRLLALWPEQRWQLACCKDDNSNTMNRHLHQAMKLNDKC